jgi:phosphoenolpyruvate synthase/pyruvate phosphate dikinase
MVRPFTKPDDVHGMIAAKGVLTSEGGATSHAAVVARQFGIPCIVGASMIKIDLEKRVMVRERQNGSRRRLDLRGWHNRQCLISAKSR